MKRSWWNSNFVTIVLLVVFFPIGLLLMWRYSSWKPPVKWGVTGAIAGLLVLSIVASALSEEEKDTVGRAPDPSPTQGEALVDAPATAVPAAATDTPSISATETPLPEEVDEPDDKTAPLLVGAIARAEDVRITIEQIVDPHFEEFVGADPGNRYVAYLIVIENVKGSQKFSNPYDFKLTDVENFQYEPSIFGATPSLGLVTLDSGGKTRGWVTFEIPETAQIAKLAYDPNLFTTSDINFLAE